MLWAACTLAFFGFLRSDGVTVLSESTFDQSVYLTFANVLVDSHKDPSMLRIKLKQSKSDPFHAGVMIFIGKAGCMLYPVAAALHI